MIPTAECQWSVILCRKHRLFIYDFIAVNKDKTDKPNTNGLRANIKFLTFWETSQTTTLEPIARNIEQWEKVTF